MTSLTAYIKDAISEVKRVKFPTRKDTIRLTGYVIGVSLATGLFVMGIDYLYKEALRLFL